MARQPRVFTPGLLYHVIARGNQRQVTFRSAQDYRTYLRRLARYREKHEIDVYAYCLMPNHVHLLVRAGQVPVAKFMQGLQQSYTQYFNRAHGQVGHLFQGRYKAIVCDRDAYLLELVRYIHLNPVRASLVAAPQHYRYSGHSAYLTGRGSAVVDPTPVLALLGGVEAYRAFVEAAVSDGHQERFYRLQPSQLPGANAPSSAQQYEDGRDASESRKPIAIAVEALAKEIPVEVGVLRGPDRGWDVSQARAIIAYLLVRRHGYRLTDVAAELGRDVAQLSKLVSRLADRGRAEGSAAQQLARLERLARPGRIG